MNKTYKIFVYGTLKNGEGNNDILNGSKYLGKDVLEGYSLYDMPYGFPFAIKDDKGVIEGDVFEVDYNTLQRVNMLEGYYDDGYRNHYERESVVSQNGHECYIYTYTTMPNCLVIKCGKKWTKQLNLKHFKGYYFK